MNTKTVLLLIAFCAFAYSQSAPASRVKYEMYIESLCPDCMNFIAQSVAPALKVQNFLEIADLTFYPYGNAKRDPTTGEVTCQHGVNECYGNKIIACGREYIAEDLLFFNFIVTLEKNIKTYYPDFNQTLTATGKALKLAAETTSNISQCANSAESDALIAVAADKTDSLVPKHTYVPWVVVNGVHDTAIEDQVINNMLEYTCKNYTGPVVLAECQKFIQEAEYKLQLPQILKSVRFNSRP